MGFDYRQPGAGLAAHPWTGAPGFDVKAHTGRMMDAGAAETAGQMAYNRAHQAGGLMNPARGLAAVTGQQGGIASLNLRPSSYAGRYGNQTLQDMHDFLRQQNPSLKWGDMRSLDAKQLTPALDYAFSAAERRRQMRGSGFLHSVVAPAVMGGLAGGIAPISAPGVAVRGGVGTVRQ